MEQKRNGAVSGLHIVGEIHTNHPPLLTNPDLVKDKISAIIKKHQFKELHAFYYSFPNAGGYTGASVLSESHVCMHTWPEYNYLTLDVFIFNYTKDNTSWTRKVFDEIVELFQPTEVKKREINR